MRPPTLVELFIQATTDTRQGYNLLAPNFEATPYATPHSWLAAAFRRVESLYGQAELGADLAAGTGRATRYLMEQCQRVEAYDFSPRMLEQAREVTGEERCRLIEADLETVDLGRERYDRIVTFGAWGHFLDPWAAGLMGRVVYALKPGGVFFTLTADPPAVLSRRSIYNFFFDESIKLRNRLLGDPFHMYYSINDTVVVKRMLEQYPCEVRLEPMPGALHPEVTLLMAVRLHRD